jgi:hypothetical protein
LERRKYVSVCGATLGRENGGAVAFNGGEMEMARDSLRGRQMETRWRIVGMQEKKMMRVGRWSSSWWSFRYVERHRVEETEELGTFN